MAFNLFKKPEPSVLDLKQGTTTPQLSEKPPLQPPEPSITTKDLAAALEVMYESILTLNQNQIYLNNGMAELKKVIEDGQEEKQKK